MVINVCLPGALDSADSYGLIACELIRHLDALGLMVNVSALGDIDHANCPPDVNEIAHRPYKKADATIFLGYPSNIYKHPEWTKRGKRILITMFESSRLPCGWLEPMQTMDAVITPSAFCKTVFADCGVTVPIHTIALGIGCVYQPFRRPQRDKLTFLTFLDRGARKGGLAAQHAFLLAFGDRTDVHLILKMRKPRVVINLTNENMTMIQEDYTEEQMYELYCSADVVVMPVKGEGFLLPAREAAVTGCISLVTNWSGPADDLRKYGWSLPYKLEKADWSGNKKLEGQDLGMWAAPNIAGVARKLKDVAKRRDWYTEKAYKRAQRVSDMYSWRRFAEKVLDVWMSVARPTEV